MATCGTDFEPCGVVEDPDVGLPPRLERQWLVLSTGLQTRAAGQHLERLRALTAVVDFRGLEKEQQQEKMEEESALRQGSEGGP
jgi:hypothetical protein